MQALIFALLFSSVSGDLYLRRKEDSEVAICGQAEICNLVHKPYFGSTLLVDKFCHCPENDKNFTCPADFLLNDGYSLPVNQRTQMKFCTPIAQLQLELDECDDEEVAIQVETTFILGSAKNVSAKMLCSCEPERPIYWEFHSRDGKYFKSDEKLFISIYNFKCRGENKNFI
jgi:hypothetical protein